MLIDIHVRRGENCYPMVPPGKSNAQMVGLPAPMPVLNAPDLLDSSCLNRRLLLLLWLRCRRRPQRRLQVRSSSLLQVGDGNRTYTALACSALMQAMRPRPPHGCVRNCRAVARSICGRSAPAKGS